MIVVPSALNFYTIQAESEAENFLLRAFIDCWMNGKARIEMREGKAMLAITNEPALMLPAENVLQNKIKKTFNP